MHTRAQPKLRKRCVPNFQYQRWLQWHPNNLPHPLVKADTAPVVWSGGDCGARAASAIPQIGFSGLGCSSPTPRACCRYNIRKTFFGESLRRRAVGLSGIFVRNKQTHVVGFVMADLTECASPRARAFATSLARAFATPRACALPHHAPVPCAPLRV